MAKVKLGSIVDDVGVDDCSGVVDLLSVSSKRRANEYAPLTSAAIERTRQMKVRKREKIELHKAPGEESELASTDNFSPGRSAHFGLCVGTVRVMRDCMRGG